MNNDDRSILQSFLIGNFLGAMSFSMIEAYKYYTNKTENDKDKEKISKQNENILSMREIMNLQLEEIEQKEKLIKEQSEIIDNQDIEIKKKDKIIKDLRAKHKKVRDKIVIEYED